jgi:trehalose/maltose hydrolase-like predicted phosphorylase
MDGRPCGWNGEPYLADQMVAAASLVHGFLGLTFTPNDFRLDPHLPPGWDKMSAEIQFQGRRYRVTAQADGQWTKEVIQPQSNESP